MPTNGFFDSKVLSRQHAEIYADRQGRIYIRDVKSSNGTFVNGMRLSPENKESEPRELKEQDMLELGIDIVSEDQKTVVHHKVAAKVEHAGIYGQGTDGLSFGELDPTAGGGILAPPSQLRRTGSQGSVNGRGTLNGAAGQSAAGVGMVNQPQHLRNWLNPITTDQIMKKLNVCIRRGSCSLRPANRVPGRAEVRHATIARALTGSSKHRGHARQQGRFAGARLQTRVGKIQPSVVSQVEDRLESALLRTTRTPTFGALTREA